LGDRDGPGAIPGFPSSVTIDPLGRYLVQFFQGELPVVFNSRGEYVSTLGRKGAGPGEFMQPQKAFVTPGDSLVIIDFHTARATVLDKSLAPIRSIALPPWQVRNLLVFDWPTRVVVNSTVRTPDRFGLPLHVMGFDGQVASIRQSFGSLNAGDITPQQQRQLYYTLAPADPGAVWAAERYRYRISKWAEDGSLQLTLTRNPEWFEGESDGLGSGPTKAPSPDNRAIMRDSAGRLWVFTLIAAPDWREAWKDVPPPAGREVPATWGAPFHTQYQTVIEVLDVSVRRVLARYTTPHAIIFALGANRVAAYREADDGTPHIVILQLDLIM
jgi:hypothetical protein